MRRFDFVTLRLFVTIAEEGRLTAPADREHLALAAVSKRVSDLESLVGAKLLYRKSRGVELTPEGHSLLHHARCILENVARLDAELNEYEEGVRGHVRIHSNTSAVIAYLPEDLSTFTREYSQTKIDLQERTSTEAVTAVRDGLTDIGIFAKHVDSSDLEIIPYKRDQLMLVTPENHPLSGQDQVFLHEAIEYDFIGLQQDTSLHSLIHIQANQTGRPLRMRIQVRSFDAICRMIHYGMGIGILPERTLYRDLRGLRLHLIPLADEWAHRELVIGMRSYEDLPVVARHLVDHLVKAKP
ncbi:LysR family transcriptional regulator [Marinobacter sp. SS13-12]|jgi:DNA-binding transcriptional LysR family regulator|uniref:LysR family transcriptional regulator n=1 Tax=Marinobacter sp. SS13-12 TaxID=3050451 RepID=UPI00255329AC|nr:LysR family transcriptional regulator [Marinobacter sp. SS13-12]MDK8465894.1 LysR family transcriptional regulator [Marinobacter sp. SS13-12]